MKIIKISLALFCIAAFASCSDFSSSEETASPTVSESSAETPVPVYSNMPELGRSDFHYIILENNELLNDELNYSLPEFVDIVSFKKNITNSEITLYIKLRGLPAELAVNQSSVHTNIIEYSWRVNFDTNYDDTISFDISLVHQKFWERTSSEQIAPLDEKSFETVGIQHQVSTGQEIAQGSISIDENTIILNFSKAEYPELGSIKNDTPIHIFTEYNNGNIYVYDLIPRE